jgi:urease accessory protein
MTPEVLARIRAAQRAATVLRAGAWRAADAIDRVVLDSDERYRRRIVLTGEGGLKFLLDLAEATPLRDGDGLKLDDGAVVAVVAKPEPLAEIAAGDGVGAASLARLAWHLGNRHTEVQLIGDCLRIRRDHVLEDMLTGLGAALTPVEAPFEPERGAYQHGQGDGRLVAESLPGVFPPPLQGEGTTAAGGQGWGHAALLNMQTPENRLNGQSTAPPLRASRASPPFAGEGKGLPACEAEAEFPHCSSALYRLMTWMSPAYPVGAFSYSSGLEWAVEASDVRDAATLTAWLTTMIDHGSVSCDAVIFCHAHRAAADGSDEALVATAELAAALAGSRERFLETTAQGQAFLQITQAAWAAPTLDRLTAAWNGPLAYPVAVAAACAGHGVALAPALHAFLHGVVSNLVSAGVRLVPLGQTDGQRVLVALEVPIARAAERTLNVALDDIGMAALRSDIASMRHETQYTRLFRT